MPSHFPKHTDFEPFLSCNYPSDGLLYKCLYCPNLSQSFFIAITSNNNKDNINMVSILLPPIAPSQLAFRPLGLTKEDHQRNSNPISPKAHQEVKKTLHPLHLFKRGFFRKILKIFLFSNEQNKRPAKQVNKLYFLLGSILFSKHWPPAI